MKKYLLSLSLLGCFVSQAQNIEDVLNVGLDRTQGSARYQALSGAMGALGGDLSAINSNPAGSAVFNYSQLGFTLTSFNRNNKTSYFNQSTNNDDVSFKFNQIGGVFVLKSPDSDWKKISIAFNYELHNNYDNEVYAIGNSNQGIDNYFLGHADGVALGNLQIGDNEFIEDAYLDIGRSLGFSEQQAFLGYQAFTINPDDEDDSNTSYSSNTPYNNGRVNQVYLQNTAGFNSKFFANFATQFQENLYLGASLNFHGISNEKLTELREDGYGPDSDVTFTNFDNFLRTDGSAFSFSLGAIAKLNKNIRIGGSYQSPTWYRLQDELSQRINSNLAPGDINQINFSLVNVFREYKIQIPSKYTGSLALIFGKLGLISFDYSYQDMSKAELSPTGDPSFSNVNREINSQLGAISTYKIGGELKLKQLSLRTGYRFEQSPYENTNVIGDLNSYSAGIGYSFGPSRLDLSFNQYKQDIGRRLYDTGFDTLAKNSLTSTQISLGYTVNF